MSPCGVTVRIIVGICQIKLLHFGIRVWLGRSSEACPSLLIWVEFELVNPQEVDRDLNVVSSATSRLIKSSRELACGWVQAAVNASLPEGVVPPALPLPQKTILGSYGF